MPLIFIHGVNVRSGPDYEKDVVARDALFRRFALSTLTSNPQKVFIANPYWGDLGARFFWNHASIPSGNIEALGSDDELLALFLSTTLGHRMPTEETVLLETAQVSLGKSIDLLWSLSLQYSADEQTTAELSDLALRALDYARHTPEPLWLVTVTNDKQFLNELINAVDQWQSSHLDAQSHDVRHWESFGFDTVWDQIREGALRIRSAAGHLTSSVLVSVARKSLHTQFARFLGDTFVYLTKRGTRETPGPIASLIIHALEQAREQIRPEDSKLIVVGHSMGGNILYDIFTSFRPDLKVDVFVTVGSQVAVFEELKLFAASDLHIPSPTHDRVKKPANVGCWLNVFDVNDVLGFATTGVFQQTSDFAYSTGLDLLSAHGSYFSFPSFHQRFAARLRSDCP